MKIIFKSIYYLFIACILAIALLLVISYLPIPGNYKVLVVQSGSMEPVIKTGGIIVLKPQADYKAGEIITFREKAGSNVTITHRVVEVKNENNQVRYITKGDANNAADPNGISKNQIVGKVLFSLPYVGYAVDTAKKPYGFLAIIIIPAAIIIFDEIKKIVYEVARIRNKNKDYQI